MERAPAPPIGREALGKHSGLDASTGGRHPDPVLTAVEILLRRLVVAEILRSPDPARAVAELEALVEAERATAAGFTGKRYAGTAAAMDAIDTFRDLERLVLQIKAELGRRATAAARDRRRSSAPTAAPVAAAS